MRKNFSSLGSSPGEGSHVPVHPAENKALPVQWLTVGAWGLPCVLSAIAFLLGSEASPGDLLFRGVCIGLLAGAGYLLVRQAKQHARQSREALAETDHVLAITKALTTLDFLPLLQRVTTEIVALVSCRGACLVLFDQRKKIEHIVTAGRFPPPLESDLPLLLPKDVFDQVRAKGYVALNNPNEIHTRLRSLRVKEFAEHNLLILDIHQQQHLSVLLLGDKLHKQGFVEREIQQLLTLAKVVAVAIDNARRFANAQRVRVDQRELLRALINAQEHESKLVADAWRERVGAELFAVLQGLRSFHMLIARRVPESQERFEQLIAEIDVLAALVRGLTDELHPVVLDDFGFVAALREYVAGFDEQESFRVIVHTEGEDQHLPNETGLTLFRVTQEALRNVRKHARAKNVQIAFVQEHAGVSLMIKDDGQGFNPEQQQSNHFGLLSMRERVEACGGTFRVLSSQGQGTEVRVSLPDKRQSPARLTHRLSS